MVDEDEEITQLRRAVISTMPAEKSKDVRVIQTNESKKNSSKRYVGHSRSEKGREKEKSTGGFEHSDLRQKLSRKEEAEHKHKISEKQSRNDEKSNMKVKSRVVSSAQSQIDKRKHGKPSLVSVASVLHSESSSTQNARAKKSGHGSEVVVLHKPHTGHSSRLLKVSSKFDSGDDSNSSDSGNDSSSGEESEAGVDSDYTIEEVNSNQDDSDSVYSVEFQNIGGSDHESSSSASEVSDNEDISKMESGLKKVEKNKNDRDIRNKGNGELNDSDLNIKPKERQVSVKKLNDLDRNNDDLENKKIHVEEGRKKISVNEEKRKSVGDREKCKISLDQYKKRMSIEERATSPANKHVIKENKVNDNTKGSKPGKRSQIATDFADKSALKKAVDYETEKQLAGIASKSAENMKKDESNKLAMKESGTTKASGRSSEANKSQKGSDISNASTRYIEAQKTSGRIADSSKASTKSAENSRASSRSTENTKASRRETDYPKTSTVSKEGTKASEKVGVSSKTSSRNIENDKASAKTVESSRDYLKKNESSNNSQESLDKLKVALRTTEKTLANEKKQSLEKDLPSQKAEEKKTGSNEREAAANKRLREDPTTKKRDEVKRDVISKSGKEEIAKKIENKAKTVVKSSKEKDKLINSQEKIAVNKTEGKDDKNVPKEAATTSVTKSVPKAYSQKRPKRSRARSGSSSSSSSYSSYSSSSGSGSDGSDSESDSGSSKSGSESSKSSGSESDSGTGSSSSSSLSSSSDSDSSSSEENFKRRKRRSESINRGSTSTRRQRSRSPRKTKDSRYFSPLRTDRREWGRPQSRDQRNDTKRGRSRDRMKQRRDDVKARQRSRDRSYDKSRDRGHDRRHDKRRDRSYDRAIDWNRRSREREVQVPKQRYRSRERRRSDSRDGDRRSRNVENDRRGQQWRDRSGRKTKIDLNGRSDDNGQRDGRDKASGMQSDHNLKRRFSPASKETAKVPSRTRKSRSASRDKTKSDSRAKPEVAKWKSEPNEHRPKRPRSKSPERLSKEEEIGDKKPISVAEIQQLKKSRENKDEVIMDNSNESVPDETPRADISIDETEVHDGRNTREDAAKGNVSSNKKDRGLEGQRVNRKRNNQRSEISKKEPKQTMPKPRPLMEITLTGLKRPSSSYNRHSRRVSVKRISSVSERSSRRNTEPRGRANDESESRRPRRILQKSSSRPESNDQTHLRKLSSGKTVLLQRSQIQPLMDPEEISFIIGDQSTRVVERKEEEFDGRPLTRRIVTESKPTHGQRSIVQVTTDNPKARKVFSRLGKQVVGKSKNIAINLKSSKESPVSPVIEKPIAKIANNEEEEDLDSRIQQIREKNEAILRRQREIEEDIKIHT